MIVSGEFCSDEQAGDRIEERKLNEGDLVRIADNGSWWTGAKIPDWIKERRWYVKTIDGIKVVLGKSEDGKYNILRPICENYLEVIVGGEREALPIKPPGEKVNEIPDDGSEVYFVQRGDSLRKIAEMYFGRGNEHRWVEIQKINGLDSDRIYAGQKLILP